MIVYNKAIPILLVILKSSNEITQHIYNELQHIKPQRLYIVYNFPVIEEQEINQEHTQNVFGKISWECNLKISHNEASLIYDAAMLKAVRWFFCQETEGIVLDSLNVPHPAFFAFCSCLLEKYRHDERIGHISGLDYLHSDKRLKEKDSYYFSKLIRISSCWASWQRVWGNMDSQLKTFSSFKKLNIMEDIPSHQPFRYQWHYWDHINNHMEAPYEYSNLINNRLSIVPNFHQVPLSEYELPEMTHPKFMVSPHSDELQLQELKYNVPAITSNQPAGLSFLRDKLLSFSKEAAQRMKIPRIIHQIYEDPAGPSANLLAIAESWKERQPDWEYRFWNKQMINDFLESTCPDFISYYRSYPFNVQRWDAIRYLILYHIGGLYVDMDYECIRPLDVLLSGSTCCMGMEPTINSKIYNKSLILGNALMASVPGHPYMKAIIEDLKANFSVDYKTNKSLQILETTGPFMVTRVYEQFKKKRNITLLPADLVTPLTIREIWMLRTGHVQPEVMKKVEEAFAIHYFYGSWNPQTDNNKKI